MALLSLHSLLHYSRMLLVSPQPGFGSRWPGNQPFPLTSPHLHLCSAGALCGKGQDIRSSPPVLTLLIITVFSCFSSRKSFLMLICSHSMQEQATLSLLQEATDTCRFTPVIWPLLSKCGQNPLVACLNAHSLLSLSWILIHRNRWNKESVF